MSTEIQTDGEVDPPAAYHRPPHDSATLSNAVLRLIGAAQGLAPIETCFSEPPDEERDADVVVLDGLVELLERREEVAELRRTLEQVRRLVGIPEPYNLVSVLQVRLRLSHRFER